MRQSAAARYTQLKGPRQPYLDRAREAAKLTIPALMPPDGTNGQTKLPTPFQGLGARGVNNLAAKLLLALLPPNSPFFRLSVDDFTLEKLTQRPGMRGEVEKGLNKVERSVMTEVETTGVRIQAGEALKQLINAGNVLLYLKPEGGLRVFHLDRYVIHRDPSGNVLEMITEESVSPSALPLEVQRLLPQEQTETAKDGTVEKTVNLYTRVTRANGRWDVEQEIKGIVIPGSRGWYPIDKTPWLPLRWTSIDGESYGRGYVEEFIGDLRSLEGLMKAIVQGSAAAAKILILVNPNGTTSVKTITDAESGAVRAGNAADVSVLGLEKFNDFRVALDTIAKIENRLAMAFMLNSAVQRNGERVTAEEIRFMAGELEDALGGVYSILSQEFQLPFVTRLMLQMEKAGKLPALPRALIRPTIVTGLEALGRGHDLNKLDMLVKGIGETFGPEAVAKFLNIPEYIKRRGTALGLDMDGLVVGDEELAAQDQQAQMQALIEKLGPKGMDIVRDQLKPEAQSGPQAAPAGAA